MNQNEPMEDDSECLWRHAANLAVLARERPAAPATQEEDIELLHMMLEAQGRWAWNGQSPGSRRQSK